MPYLELAALIFLFTVQLTMMIKGSLLLSAPVVFSPIYPETANGWIYTKLCIGYFLVDVIFVVRSRGIDFVGVKIAYSHRLIQFIEGRQ